MKAKHIPYAAGGTVVAAGALIAVIAVAMTGSTHQPPAPAAHSSLAPLRASTTSAPAAGLPAGDAACAYLESALGSDESSFTADAGNLTALLNDLGTMNGQLAHSLELTTDATLTAQVNAVIGDVSSFASAAQNGDVSQVEADAQKLEADASTLQSACNQAGE